MQSAQETSNDNANYFALEDNGTLIERIQNTLSEFEKDKQSASHVTVLKSLLSQSQQKKEPITTLSEAISGYLKDIPPETTCCFISKEAPLKTKLQNELKNQSQPTRNKSGSMEIPTVAYVKIKTDLASAKSTIKELEQKLRKAEEREAKLRSDFEKQSVGTPKSTLATPLADDKQMDEAWTSQIRDLEESLNSATREVAKLKAELAAEKQKNQKVMQPTTLSSGKAIGSSSLDSRDSSLLGTSFRLHGKSISMTAVGENSIPSADNVVGIHNK
ncbi:hypothetical protein AYO45_01875 [Gammaproteobacteria bacterium SCGC AG-212-F23]|nr:hypothetical protein AYO45_01875 [Gammaproteobacteria bacterium SCGC AG-212-F23]